MVPSRKRQLEPSPVFTHDLSTKKNLSSIQAPECVATPAFMTTDGLVAGSIQDTTKTKPTDTIASQSNIKEAPNDENRVFEKKDNSLRHGVTLRNDYGENGVRCRTFARPAEYDQ